MMKSRGMRWTKEKTSSYRILIEKTEAMRRPGRLCMDGRIILILMLEKWDWVVWNGLNWLRIEASDRLLATC
jgi:hypothetical protein